MAAASRLKDARWAWTAYQEMKRLGLPLQVAVCKQLIRALTRGKVHPHRGRGADSERAWTALTECVAQFATVHRPPAASGMWHVAPHVSPRYLIFVAPHNHACMYSQVLRRPWDRCQMWSCLRWPWMRACSASSRPTTKALTPREPG